MSKRRKFIIGFLAVLILGLLIPQEFSMPIDKATKSSFNQKSFWYYPWGKSITHKGVDIFSKEGTLINSATSGLVVYCGNIKMGGNVVLVLGPKWRIHYYAHLQSITTSNFSFVNKNSQIGKLGTTGNAIGKEPHLHYSILSLIPYFWRIDNSKQGWKKMFYLNPIEFLNHYFEKN